MKTTVRTRSKDTAALALLQPEFDASYYRTQLPQLRLPDQALLAHYLREGWRQGKSPSRVFSVPRYLGAYPDVAAAGIEPLQHFLLNGKAEGRRAFPVEQAPTQAVPSEWLAAVMHFDAQHYLRAYDDVARSGASAFEHFMTVGWREGRDPSPRFCTRYYLASNPDVQALGINPLLHYVQSGRDEGRTPRHPGGWQADVLARTVDVRERAISLRRRPPARLLPAAELDALLAGHLATRKAPRVVVSLGHDRYFENIGGIQVCVREEQHLLNEAGVVYLYINPHQPLPHLSNEDIACWLCDVSLDGSLAGTLTGDQVLKVLGRRLRTVESHLCIHSLLGHNPSWPERLAQEVAFAGSYFWLHDYFTLCPGFNLLRNDVSFCHAPGVGSDACNLCVYGAERRMHLERLASLFDAVPFNVLAPSQAALALWQQRTSLPSRSVRVLEHRTPVPLAPARPSLRTPDQPVRVAFLGHPAAHKGWNAFRELAHALAHDRRYELFHLGTGADPTLPVTHVEVRSTPQDPDAMRSAVEANAVDIALLLSHWPETFCLAAYEAMAGGAAVYAFEGSGNAADMVRRYGAGCTFDAWATLSAHFQTGAAYEEARSRRGQGAARWALASSGITAALLGPTKPDAGEARPRTRARTLEASK